MGFWKNLRAILSGPDILNELASTQEKLRETERELDVCIGQAETNDLLWQSQVDQAKCEAISYRAALLAVCPSPTSPGDMKQLYHTIAPHLDKHGFELYRTAKRLTDIDVCSAFPYEDNRGMFEEADGYRLLRYLTAAYFHAVKWEIVPGTCHEKATLMEIDTAAPEYREFERELYEGALMRLGFQEILTPGQESVRETAKGRQPEQKRGDVR